MIRGKVTPLGKPFRSVHDQWITGVIQKFSVKEHVVARTTAGFWLLYYFLKMYNTHNPNQKFDLIKISVLRNVKKNWKESLISNMSRTFIMRNNNVKKLFKEKCIKNQLIIGKIQFFYSKWTFLFYLDRHE